MVQNFLSTGWLRSTYLLTCWRGKETNSIVNQFVIIITFKIMFKEMFVPWMGDCIVESWWCHSHTLPGVMGANLNILSGREGWNTLSVLRDQVWRRGQIVILCKYLMMPCIAAWTEGRKDVIGWLHMSWRKHLLYFTLHSLQGFFFGYLHICLLSVPRLNIQWQI